MKKFLLITYYWPPAGGAGVMRWAKMSRYISEYGWEPVIYTPSNGETGMYDESLLREIPSHIKVIKRPIWEPYDLYKLLLGRSRKEKLYSGFINEKKKASFAQKLSVFIRGNFFIPDARMFWIRPSVRFLKKYLRENPVDVIVSTGPPHSMHLIAEKLHAALGVPWIADFRDPWTNIDFYRDLHLTRWADRKHHRLEDRVLRHASRIVTVTWRSRDEFQTQCGREDIEVIPNGFDHADFTTLPSSELDPEFTIAHIGSMNKDRNPVALWKAIAIAISERPELAAVLKIKLVGPVDFSVRESVVQHGLQPMVTFVEHVPHTEAVRIQQRARIVLLVINDSPNSRTIIPGKLYEYLGCGRPILAIGPQDSDSAHVIRMTRGGDVFDHHDVTAIKEKLLQSFRAFQEGHLTIDSTGTAQFTRQNLSRQYAELLSDIT